MMNATARRSTGQHTGPRTLPLGLFWTMLWGLSLVLLVEERLRAFDFNEIARFDLSATSIDVENPEPHDIGSNPIAVAWNGSKLYVAGYNGSGDTVNNLDVGIVEITNATATGLVDAPSFGTAFGLISTPTFRAYSGLDLSADGTALAATHDNGSGDNSHGIQLFNTSDNSQRWAFEARTATGPAFDPGWSGDETGDGVATGAAGSGRRHLYDTADGTELFGPTGGFSTPGFVWTSGSGGFLPRDMDFDPLGNLYVRHNNRITKTNRDGGNSATDQTIVVDPYGDPSDPTGDNFLGQNLSFISGVHQGDLAADLIIYNDKESNDADQPFADAVKVVLPTGEESPPHFSLLDGGSMANGSATYDFDFDPASQTLALLDFSNRNVHIFAVGGGGGFNDLNGDGFVDGLDLGILLGNFGQNADPSGGELNGTDPVDGLDLGILLGAWNPPPGSAAVAQVPEPSTCLLTLLASSLVAVNVHRRRGRVDC